MKVHLGKFHKRRKRKIKIRIDDYDTWNVDHTLALIIHPLLKKYTESIASYPSEFADPNEYDYLAGQLSFEGEGWDVPDVGLNRWKTILDKMIWSFEQLLDDDWENQYMSGEADFQFVPIPDSDSSRMVTGPKHTLVINEAGIKAHRERIQEGLDLFAKYYTNLWD